MKGCLFSGKNQRFIKIRVLFWPEISALGVFLNFDNERMRPLNTQVPPPPPPPPGIGGAMGAAVEVLSYDFVSMWCFS